MDRRAFLKDAAATLLVLPFGTFLLHCESDDKEDEVPVQPDNSPPGAEPRLEGDSILFTSNKVLKHTHTFPVLIEAFDSPPEDGVSGETSVSDGHSHALMLTRAALQMAAAGQAVKIQTATTDNHSHTFSIIKIET